MRKLTPRKIELDKLRPSVTLVAFATIMIIMSILASSQPIWAIVALILNILAFVFLMRDKKDLRR